MDQTRINWSVWGWGLVPHPCPILSLVIFDYWKTWLKLVMLENLQACLLRKFVVKRRESGAYFKNWIDNQLHQGCQTVAKHIKKPQTFIEIKNNMRRLLICNHHKNGGTAKYYNVNFWLLVWWGRFWNNSAENFSIFGRSLLRIVWFSLQKMAKIHFETLSETSEL